VGQIEEAEAGGENFVKNHGSAAP